MRDLVVAVRGDGLGLVVLPPEDGRRREGLDLADELGLVAVGLRHSRARHPDRGRELDVQRHHLRVRAAYAVVRRAHVVAPVLHLGFLLDRSLSYVVKRHYTQNLPIFIFYLGCT